MALITETRLRAQLAKGIPNPYPLREGDKLTPAAADFLKSRGIGLTWSSGKPVALPQKADPHLRQIPVGVSNRHAHLSPGHVEQLFGPGYKLTPLKELSQKGQFAAQETVTLVGPKGFIAGVRVLGPARGATQVEISRTDGFALGVHPPLRLSGDHEGTPGITIIGPKGSVVLDRGLIVAKNHVHLSPAEAEIYQVAAGDRLILQTAGERKMIFADVAVRIGANFSADFHIDLDEANAAFLRTGDMVQIIGKNGQINVPPGSDGLQGG